MHGRYFPEERLGALLCRFGAVPQATRVDVVCQHLVAFAYVLKSTLGNYCYVYTYICIYIYIISVCVFS